MPLKEKETKLYENILNCLVSCVFWSMAISLLSGEFFVISSLFRETRPRSALIKRSPSFQPTLLVLECLCGNMASTGHSSNISISWCQMLEGMTGTDSQSGGVVYVGRDSGGHVVWPLLKKKLTSKSNLGSPELSQFSLLEGIAVAHWGFFRTTHLYRNLFSPYVMAIIDCTGGRTEN